MSIEKFLYPSLSVRYIITGPSECGKSVFLINLILYIFYEHNEIYIYSPSLHQDLCQNYLNVLVTIYQFT